MNTFNKLFGAFALVIVFFMFVALLMGLPVMWLWNWLMPELFGLKTIGFWQAVGLNILSSILFRPTINVKSDR